MLGISAEGSYPYFHQLVLLCTTVASMNTQAQLIKARESWLKVYQDLGSITKADRRCGIARSTLYRWIERSREGLQDKS